MLTSMSTTEWSDVGVNELPTGTVTLLLADVEGSTRLWETQPEVMAAAVARLDQALSEAVAAHDGVRPVEQGEGDSFVIAFDRACDAVACALDLQRAPLAPIRLRIGIHTGDVRLRDEGNYVGPCKRTFRTSTPSSASPRASSWYAMRSWAARHQSSRELAPAPDNAHHTNML